ncbi:Phenylacetate-coenzyme A ligase [compost metagenome]
MPSGEEARAALEAEAEHLVKVHIGVTCAVRVVPPGTIERSEGKAKRVIDRRPKA